MNFFVFGCLIFFLNTFVNSIKFQDQKITILGVEDNICRPEFCKTPAISSTVKKYCDENGYLMEYRCCINRNANDSIMAIDYMGCYIQKLSNTVGVLNKNKIRNTEILDVRNNTLEECGSLESYSGFVNLNELYLAGLVGDICQCPGGSYSWTNFTSGFCIGRKNICGSNFSSFINCTLNSNCIENGPGNFLCECKPNFHGYKCLEEGKFPTLIFSLALSVVTIFLSAFLWQTQRKYVKLNQ